MSDFEILLERLSAICGDCDDPYFVVFNKTDMYTQRILNSGIILLDSSITETAEENRILVKVRHLSMTPNDCHRDAFKALAMYPELSFMTGYVCCDGSWYVHSWLYSEKEKIVLEPCIDTVTECYYGVALTEQEIENFRKEVVVGNYIIKEHGLNRNDMLKTLHECNVVLL